jgi:hypothetical protein
MGPRIFPVAGRAWPVSLWFRRDVLRERVGEEFYGAPTGRVVVVERLFDW